MLINSCKAGFLTYPACFRAFSGEILPMAECGGMCPRKAGIGGDLQQQVLSRIHTAFPFLCIGKVNDYCGIVQI